MYSSYSISSGLSLSTIGIIALILGIAATVLAFIFLVPDKKAEKLNKFGKAIHSLLTFKFLFIEKILQALYIFTTAFIILEGFLMLFSSYFGVYLGGYGILIMILGPIVVRIIYEILMMTILLIKNVIQINNKLKNQNDCPTKKSQFDVPTVEEIKAEYKSAPTPAPQTPNFCSKCGSSLNPDGSCPNCN